MKTSLWILALVGAMALAGCDSKGKEAGGYTGAWKMDFSKMLAVQRAAVQKSGSPEALKQFEASMATMRGDLAIQADHTFTMDLSMGPTGEMKESSAGTWTSDGSSITLTLTTKGGKKPEGDEAKPMTFALKDGKLEGRTPAGDETITFVR